MDRNVQGGSVHSGVSVVALLAEGVDRNKKSRGALTRPLVALLAEGVDRNAVDFLRKGASGVALLAEGVDRNLFFAQSLVKTYVALLAEGVDRNSRPLDDQPNVLGSPSSRRAWIEINEKVQELFVDSRRPPRGGRG